MDTISKGLATQDINKAIHCIWYCINTASNRIEPEEIEWLNSYHQTVYEKLSPSLNKEEQAWLKEATNQL